ncbi:MAG: FHA domain-containing protein [Planctomycetota bacterium]|nr:FHA domain-containing protein [Planctomycetota bacterium]
MAYYLTVASGPDQGRSILVSEGEVLIGRSPSAHLQLKDPAISWEHAVARIEDGRLVLRNLSALGTKIRGKRISTDTRLAAEDEVELTEATRLLVVAEQAESGATLSPLAIVLIALLLLGVSGGGVAAVLMMESSSDPPVTARHWRQGYVRLLERMEQWQVQGSMPQRAVELFRNAWRLEQVSINTRAARQWEELNSMFLTLTAPELTGDQLTLAESAGSTSKALNVIMGWDQKANASDFEFNTTDAYADALVWFVRKRAEITRKAAAAAEAGKGSK